MSGIQPLHLTHFYRRLRRRGHDAGTLADKIVSGRTHVTEVINGTKDSPRTRRRLARYLKPEELGLLGWDKHGAVVPRSTLSQERHFPAEVSTP